MGKAKKQTRRTRIEWTPEQDAAIIDAYNNNRNIKELAAKWDIHNHSIYRRADKLGLTGRNDFTFREIEYIKKHFPTHVPVSDIAKALGRNEKSIITKAGHLGVKRPQFYKALHLTPQVEAENVRLYVDELEHIEDIASRFKTTWRTVRKILSKHDVEIRSKSETVMLRYKKGPFIIPFSELYNLYFVECLSHDRIQQIYGIGRKALQYNLDHHGIQRRHMDERKAMLDEFKDRERTFKDKVKE